MTESAGGDERTVRLPENAWIDAPWTRAVLAALTAQGRIVRFVGGCVRNTLIGREVVDIDIATPDPPETVMALLGTAGVRAIPTGIAHGTVTAVRDGRAFEITTLRRDVRAFGRHAEVAFTEDWEADARRRDFTMNALYADPDGRIYDPVGGLADLEARRVRFIGEPQARIREDYLRILRFFRFHAWYGAGPPDPEGLRAVAEEREGLRRLSAERVRDEFLKILAAPDPLPVLRAMAETGVLKIVLPEAHAFERLERLIAIEASLSETDPIRRLGALTLKDSRMRSLRRFGIPTDADPPIASFTSDQNTKVHPDYRAAKAGDPAAAARLVSDLVKPETVAEARRRFGPEAIYVPVIAEEASGRNKIPELLAHYYAMSIGTRVEDEIVQANRPHHTGARPLERLIARPIFDGPVQFGESYTLVDDVSVLGGTLSELANHIQSHGGKVVGAVLLVNASRSGQLTAKSLHVRMIEERFGDEIRRQFGIEPAALTADEARYLLGYRDADGLRNGILKARSERNQRLRAKNLFSSQTENGSLTASQAEAGEMEALVDRLRLSNKEKDRLVRTAHDRGRLWTKMSPPAVRAALYELGKETFRDLALLAWADEATADPDAWRDILALARDWTPPRFPLTGEDAMALGVESGPEMGRRLRETEAWWIANDFAPDRSALRAHLAGLIEAARPR